MLRAGVNRYKSMGVGSVTLKKLVRGGRAGSKAIIAGVGIELRDALIYGAEWSKIGKAMLGIEKQFGLVARLLVRYQAQVDEKDVDGVTPLMIASRHDLVRAARRASEGTTLHKLTESSCVCSGTW